MPNFEKYSAFYDLLYRDKDYAAEADYVAERIRSVVPDARSILEFGSGTGRHGRLLAAMGFDVHGIERSRGDGFRGAATGHALRRWPGSFTCEVGDICTARSWAHIRCGHLALSCHELSDEQSGFARGVSDCGTPPRAGWGVPVRRLARAGRLSQRPIGANQGSRRRPLSREADRATGARYEPQHGQGRLYEWNARIAHAERPSGSAKST